MIVVSSTSTFLILHSSSEASPLGLICSLLHDGTYGTQHLSLSVTFPWISVYQFPSLDDLPWFLKVRSSPYDNFVLLCLASSLRKQLVPKFIVTFLLGAKLLNDTTSIFQLLRRKLSRKTLSAHRPRWSSKMLANWRDSLPRSSALPRSRRSFTLGLQAFEWEKPSSLQSSACKDSPNHP